MLSPMDEVELVMTRCFVEIVGKPARNEAYEFENRPLVGDHVALELFQGAYPIYKVVAVKHFPDGVDVDGKPAHTILIVKADEI